MGQLGERFLKLRSDFDDDKMLDKCDENEGNEKIMRSELKKVFSEFISNVEVINVKFSKKHVSSLKQIAKLIVRLRAPSYARWQGDDLVDYVPPSPEKPTRVYKQLKKLTKSLCCIHKLEWPNAEIMNKITRVALDSAPPDRLKVYRYLCENGNSSQADVVRGTDIPKTSVRRILLVLKEVQLIGGVWQGEYNNEYWPNGEYVSLLKSWDMAPLNKERVYVLKPPVEESIK